MKTHIKNLLLLPVLIAGLGLVLPAYAQTQVQWAKRVASTIDTDNELAIGMTLDTSGNCYVTGWFDGTNNFGGVTLTNDSGGGQDIFVAKYNTNGAIQWAHRAGGSTANRDAGRGIGVDTAGNVYVTGGFYGPADFGSFNLPADPSGYEEFFLAKYNSAGAVQWVQKANRVGGIGYSDGAYGTGLAVDSAGNSYAVGYGYGSNITFGSTSLLIPSSYAESTFLVKYDNTGTLQWAQLMGGAGEVYATKVAVDAAGNVYVHGTFQTSLTIGNINLASAVSHNMFIAKFNSSGVVTWVQQSVGGDGGESGVAVDQSQNVYVSGYFTNTLNLGTIILTSAGSSYDAFLAKYNSYGAIQWARQTTGTSNIDIYFDVALDGQGNVYAAGALSSVAAVAEYNSSGTFQRSYISSNSPANSGISVVSKCAVDSAGNCYLAGWYQGTNTWGTNVLQPQGYFNYFLTKLTPLPLQVLFFDNFGQFTNGTDLTSTNYIPASGPSSASVVTSVQNGAPTIKATNFLGNTWAFFNNSVVTNKNQYEGILPSAQINQPLQVTWNMWIQATNTGPGMFLFSIPSSDPVNNYNPPIAFMDTGAIVALTNGTSPQIPIGNWGSLAGTIMTNTLILNYPSHTFSYSLNGQTLTNLPLGPYFTNVIGAIYFNGFERSAGSLGNRFAISDVQVELVTPLVVTTTLLPNGTNGAAYSQTLTATGGKTPYTWTNISGTLPPGLNLSTNGVISGIPTNNGIFSFTVKLTDTNSNTASQPLTLSVGMTPSASLQQTNNLVTVIIGNNITLAVSVGGTGPFAFQWQLNGTNLPNGIITTVAGNGTNGFSGDGGVATNAELSYPGGVAVDAIGNLLFTDSSNKIRKVGTNGIITSVAGNGTNGIFGDGGAATNAELSFPCGVAVDAMGNFFIADQYNNVIRKVGTNGIITTVAGNGTNYFTGGYLGDGGLATNAELNGPQGVTVTANGNIFISDSHDHIIRKVGTNGIITTVAGNGYITNSPFGAGGYSGDGGFATNAELNYPQHVAFDAIGDMFIPDFWNNVIREVSTNGIITTVAGNGYGAGNYNTGGYSGDSGIAANAELNAPTDVAIDSYGNLFIDDDYNNVIRKVGTNGIITTVAGNGTNGFSGDGGAATNAELSLAGEGGIGVDSNGNLFIADGGNNRIRKVVILGPTLVLNNVGFGNSGVYDCIVSSPYGSVTSSVVNVTVILPVFVSTPQISSGKTNFTFQLSGPSGTNIVLQVSTDLFNWSPVSTSSIPVGGTITFTNSISGSNRRFYRVQYQ